jgi:hypothetical protein
MLLIPGIFASRFTPQGDFESIATVTVGAGGTSTISFTSIPSTYQHLQVRIRALASTTDNLRIRFNNDSGTNYATHQLQGTGASVAANALSSVSSAEYLGLIISSTLYPFVSVIDVLDYANGNKNKTIRALSGQDGNATGTATDWRVSLNSGLWMNTTAINRLDFTGGATFREGSHFALYGIKG